MRRSIILFLVLASLLLAGCLPQAQASPTIAVTATKTVRSIPTVTLAVPTQALLLPDSGCTVVTQKPTPGPTPVSIYPPVTASDWVKGPATAKVTIIEYSDFQ